MLIKDRVADAHAVVTIDTGKLGPEPVIPVSYEHRTNTFGIRILDGPVNVWLNGTPDEMKAFLADVATAFDNAVAKLGRTEGGT